MTWTTMLWFLAGVLIGTLHVLLLWRAAQPPLHSLGTGLLRLLGVTILLVGAALTGALLPAACGWGSGFIFSVVGTTVWKRR